MTSIFDEADAFALRVKDTTRSLLPRDFRVVGKRPTLRRHRARGFDWIMLHSTPARTGVDSEFLFTFIVGRSFEIAMDVRRKLKTFGTNAHIQNDADRLIGLDGISRSCEFAWIADVRDSPRSLGEAIARWAPQIAEPFYRRFTDPRVSRDALVAEDPWCRGGTARWANILELDLALGEVSRFKAWAKALSEGEQAASEYLIQCFESSRRDA